MKRVVHLLTYLDSQTGGMERQALQLVTQLREKGHEIFFVTCVHRRKMKEYGLERKGAINGCCVFRIPLFAGQAKVNALLYFFGSLFILFRSRNEYDIIHAHQLWTSGIVACAAKMFLPRKKVIIKNCSGGEIGDIRQMKKIPFSNKLLSFMHNEADVCIAVSDETLQEMRGVGYTKIRQIPNGVDTNQFVPLEVEQRARLKRLMIPNHADKKIVLFVGRLFPKKRVSVLIQAVARQSSDVMLVVVGDGVLLSDLEEQVRLGNLEDRVIFTGSQGRVHRYYQIADVFVLPSRNEGMPNSLLEAMSAGVPCIGSDIPSITSIIQNAENGFVFPLDDVEQLTEKLRILCEDEEMQKRFSQYARKTIESDYSFTHVVERYSQLYENC